MKSAPTTVARMSVHERRPQNSRVPGLLVIAACLCCLIGGFLAGSLYTKETLKGAGASLVTQNVPQISSVTKSKASSVCLNTCDKANNGICEDGRGDKPGDQIVLCDLGTDCNDCGPWTPSKPPTWAATGQQGPIALLRSKNVQVRVRNTSSTPMFKFAYTDPAKDYDVSRSMDSGGMVEPKITMIFWSIFKDRCVKSKGQRELFVDVGANFGWYSILAGVMGCRVLAFEPVPHFHAFLEYNVHLNGLAHLIDMQTSVISHESGSELEMVVPSTGIWGTAGIGGYNIDKAIQSENQVIKVLSRTLSDAVYEDVLLMKVDVEGWEWSVMRGAARLLADHKVENIVMEYSPGVPERAHRYDDIIATVQMLMELVNRGFRVGHIDSQHHLASAAWLDGAPSLEEVKRENLMYDMMDAAKYKSAQLGCPIPEEMRPWWQACSVLPEDLNPRSLRSVLGHNTNLWLSKNTSLLKLQGQIGIFNLTEPSTTWFIPEGSHVGMGGRDCRGIDPKFQVRHRCRCSNAAVCGQEGEVVERMAKAGKIASNYVL